MAERFDWSSFNPYDALALADDEDGEQTEWDDDDDDMGGELLLDFAFVAPQPLLYSSAFVTAMTAIVAELSSAVEP